MMHAFRRNFSDSRRMRAMHYVALVACIFAAFACSKSEETENPKTERRAADLKPVVVTGSVNKPKVDIGDKVTYSLKVLYNAEYDVDFPAVMDNFANWVLLDIGTWRDVPDEGTKKAKKLDMKLDPGIGPTLRIPPATVRYKKKGAADWSELKTDEITVEVTSVAETPGEFREPLDAFELPPAPVEATARDRRIWYIAGGSAAVLAGIAFFVLRKKKRASYVQPLAAHEIAQRDLAHLLSLGLLDRGEVKEFYFRLTMILRRYIESRFGIMAPERTTEEFLVDMKTNAALTDDHKRTLAEFLTSADMVKYAKFVPAADEGKKALATAEKFVMSTLQVAQAPKKVAETVATGAEAGHAV